jgi:hypothetical protein
VQVRAVLAPFADNPLLARLESNRLLLYLHLIDAQDEDVKRRRLDADRSVKLESELDAARAEVAVVREALRQAHAERDAAVNAATMASPSTPPPALKRFVSAVRGR